MSLNYIDFIKVIHQHKLTFDQTGGSKKQWMDNFLSLYEHVKPTNNINDINFSRALAYDDKQKTNKHGIYREKYEDKNDLDKQGNPKTKFRYYYMKDGKVVTIEDQIRINKLGLAPAYEDVWVSEDPTSKIQATGMDSKRRKQYRYNSKHLEEANVDKFLRLYKFIKSIHKLDNAMETDSTAPLYTKHRTITVMLKLIRELNMRVGKEIYAQKNKSYGVCSMKKSHVKIDTDKLIAKFNFKAKSNKQVQYTLDNPEIVKELIELMKLDGEKLFQYKTESGTIQKVSDLDLNQYIQDKMGKGFSAKDFRTYAANFHFIKALLKETRARNPMTEKIAKKNLSLAQENTAFYLRHTKSISKKSYTMGLIRDTYMNDRDYFIQNKNKQPLTVLLDLLKKFKDNINAERKKNKEAEIDEEKIEIKEEPEED
jgi:DNA topoisomerase-1